jgi:hypothetical protein
MVYQQVLQDYAVYRVPCSIPTYMTTVGWWGNPELLYTSYHYQ